MRHPSSILGSSTTYLNYYNKYVIEKEEGFFIQYICRICGKLKDESEFYRRSDTGKLRTECKVCCSNRSLTLEQKEAKQLYDKQRYQNNRTQILEQARQHRKTNKQEILLKEREYNLLHRDAILTRKKKYNKQYYEQNKHAILAKYKHMYLNTKYGIDRRMLNVFSKCFHKCERDVQYDFNAFGLSYTFQDVIKKFDILLHNMGLNYSDYGTKWEIDHIIPRNLFNYNSIQDKEFKICWSLLNLRPLLIESNRSRPKDGSDISEKQKNEIMNQDF